MFARVRKCLVAGAGAGVSAFVGALAAAPAIDRDEVAKALGVALVAAAGVAFATWGVPNAKA
ncbi:hypothetical protein [Krasilnikovia sp. MM14-A1259]|uniref:hypothetical protein n=1 Tax=Krasilnikovia sp. MM14-A1259 TaxID=3373539 RepID=UPI00381F1E54